MTSSHTPKQPTAEQFARLCEMKVDIINGKVYGLRRPRTEIGSVMGPGKGYVYITVTTEGKVKSLKRANVVWWAATGEWPSAMLDHKDRNGHNDRYDNLEPTNSSKNACNSDYYDRCIAQSKHKLKGPRRNRSRNYPEGVYLRAFSQWVKKPYEARLRRNGKNLHIGYFATVEQAEAAYQAKLVELMELRNAS